MSHPIAGLNYFLDGLHLITQPGLRRYVVIPIAINLILFAMLFLLTKHFLGDFNTWLLSHLPHWLHWLNTIIWLLFILSFFLIFTYTFVALSNLIAAPFNSLLAEQVEFHLTGKKPTSLSTMDLLKDTPRIFGRQLAILGYYLPRAILILILFLIPIVHLPAVVLWFLFNTWFVTMTYLDYPTDNHRIPLTRVKIWMKQQRWMCLGFGSSVLLMSMVPIVNLLAMPAAVAGATRLWIEKSSA